MKIEDKKEGMKVKADRVRKTVIKKPRPSSSDHKKLWKSLDPFLQMNSKEKN